MIYNVLQIIMALFSSIKSKVKNVNMHLYTIDGNISAKRQLPQRCGLLYNTRYLKKFNISNCTESDYILRFLKFGNCLLSCQSI